MDGIALTFESEALDLVVDHAVSRKLGARGLRGICKSSFATPCLTCRSDTKSLKVTAKYAQAQIDAQHESFDTPDTPAVDAKAS